MKAPIFIVLLFIKCLEGYAELKLSSQRHSDTK